MKDRREDEGQLIKGSNYFKYFQQRGQSFDGGGKSRDSYYSRKYGHQNVFCFKFCLEIKNSIKKSLQLIFALPPSN